MLQHGPDCPWLALSEQQVGEMNDGKVQPVVDSRIRMVENMAVLNLSLSSFGCLTHDAVSIKISV